MDSLTQIVLGSTVAALVTPARHRRLALVSGAVLGTIPDLDAVLFEFMGSDVMTTVTWHRGPSHSLFILPILGWLLWLPFKHFNVRVREAPRSWLIAIWLALLTHPLLDAFTSYGTQLFWPIQTPPVMWSTIFIIDPLYTLPLLVGVIMAWLKAVPEEAYNTDQNRNKKQASYNWLMIGFIISSLYLSWSVVAKFRVNQIASSSLEKMGLEDAPRFSTATAFNTLLWRVIVMTPDGYYIGDRSLIVDNGEMHFRFYTNNREALKQLSFDPQLQRLMWFTHGFVRVNTQIEDDGEQHLIVSDLRMGTEPDYFFRYDVASKNGEGNWEARPITQVSETHDPVKILSWVWNRLWGT